MSSATTERPRIGSNEWIEQVKLAIRSRNSDSVKSGDEVRLSSVPVEFKMDGDDTHAFTAQITKNISDRDNEVVKPEGGDFSDFNSSGAVFWNHDYDRPIATGGKLTRPHGGDSVFGRARFMQRPDDYVGEFFPDFARAFVTQMKLAGKMPGVSIGFIPTESRRPTKKDYSEYGEHITNVITRWKLLEWSIAPVQSNPEAYVTAVGKSLGATACKALFGMEPPAEQVNPIIRKHITVFIENPAPKRAVKARPKIDKEAIAERIVREHIAKQKGLIHA